MKQARNVLLTFDYEPFLGAKSGTAERCMLKPTDSLRAVMNKYHAKGVFFVDTLYILNLKQQPSLKNDLEAISNQLKTLYSEGHYIFPHIHPHWLDAVYIDSINEFSLTELSRYSLAKLNKPEVEGLFHESIAFLKSIGIDFPDWGYRAGGWCIQPFSSLKDVFISENIGFDFSVLPGYKNDTPSQVFDFSMITKNIPYRFSDEVEEPVTGGIFVEFPISTIQLSGASLLVSKIINKYLWKTGDKSWGDGIGAPTAALKVNLFNREMISIELLNAAKLNEYKSYLEREEYMHWISHPKMFTKHGLKMLDRFLKFADDNYDVNFDFKKMINSR